jgi:malonate-semialdehyde dehydrogenase (acetylating)/methylmalonate-semialdehyde dehydrogenase
MRTIDHWIGGRSTPGSGTATAPVWNPATGEQQAEVRLGTAGDLAEAVRVAHDAFAEWSQASLTRRAKVLFAFRQLVEAHAAELAGLVTDEHGKTLADAMGEVMRGLEVVEFS